MRSFGVILFIAMIAAVALYCAQRPTVAKGSALATTLMESSPSIEEMECDDRVPITVDGATFGCSARFKDGSSGHFTFKMNREGQIRTDNSPRIKKTSDPWGE